MNSTSDTDVFFVVSFALLLLHCARVLHNRFRSEVATECVNALTGTLLACNLFRLSDENLKKAATVRWNSNVSTKAKWHQRRVDLENAVKRIISTKQNWTDLGYANAKIKELRRKEYFSCQSVELPTPPESTNKEINFMFSFVSFVSFVEFGIAWFQLWVFGTSTRSRWKCDIADATQMHLTQSQPVKYRQFMNERGKKRRRKKAKKRFRFVLFAYFWFIWSQPIILALSCE